METTRPEVFVDTFTLSLCHSQVEISAPEIHLKRWQFLPLPVLNAPETDVTTCIEVPCGCLCLSSGLLGGGAAPIKTGGAGAAPLETVPTLKDYN